MKVAVVLISTFAIICGTLSAPQLRADDDDLDQSNLAKAAACDPDACKPPSCRCSSTVLDGVPVEQTPQVRHK